MSDAAEVMASNRYIDAELVERLKNVEEAFKADVITCITPIGQPIDDFIRDAMEKLADDEGKRNDLLVILETEGGSIETTERIANTFRHHYSGEVSFLIPNFAMSAGTILVMSGDRILMDYYSILGPIDPQIPHQSGDFVPGMGYLVKFDEFIKKSQAGKLSPAEMAILLEKFDPAMLHFLEQARDHGVDLLKLWLVQYKFKNWSKTETHGTVVTEAMKKRRAEEIARKLNDTKKWRSHGRGISMEVVRNDLNLKVEDYGTETGLAELKRCVTLYYRLMKDYMGRRGWNVVIHTRKSRFAA